MIPKIFEKLVFRKKSQRNSPDWAFLEGFRIPSLDPPYDDYLWRIRLFQCPLFGIMLHKILLPDSRPMLHSHPWAFVSLVLSKGGYTEFVQCNCKFDHCDYYAVPNPVKRMNVKRFNNSYHWIDELDQTPTWTLVFVGRRRRIWGYLDRDGKVTNYDEHDYNNQYLKALAHRGGERVV